MFARNVLYLDDHSRVLNDDNEIKKVRENIEHGDICIARNVFPKPLIRQMIEYLIRIGSGSFPNYRKIDRGCPNFHRINLWDPRAYVQGCFHQFVFFPWNQDVFNLFEITAEVYHMKNLLSGNRRDKFLGIEPEDGCTSRLAFQFYPRGVGRLNKHSDPVDHHQLSVPTLTMSKKGVDFKEGGAYAERETGEKIYLDDLSEPGDVVYFNAIIPHGVERIDPNSKVDWLSFEGRWMLLFATNKLSGNSAIRDAADLELENQNL